MHSRYVVRNGYTLLIQPSLGNRQLETVENIPTDNMNSANSIVWVEADHFDEFMTEFRAVFKLLEFRKAIKEDNSKLRLGSVWLRVDLWGWHVKIIFCFCQNGISNVPLTNSMQWPRLNPSTSGLVRKSENSTLSPNISYGQHIQKSTFGLMNRWKSLTEIHKTNWLWPNTLLPVSLCSITDIVRKAQQHSVKWFSLHTHWLQCNRVTYLRHPISQLWIRRKTS